MNKHLLNFLLSKGAIEMGDFVGKSGKNYCIETDIRKAMLSYKDAMEVGKMVHEAIVEKTNLQIPVIGVPETGSFVSQFVNYAYYEKGHNNFHCNMLRAEPKTYQEITQSSYTVIPLQKENEFILLEDDVVTGNTVDKYLNYLTNCNINIIAVVAIFGRKSATTLVDKCLKNSIKYFELINTDEVERML